MYDSDKSGSNITKWNAYYGIQTVSLVALLSGYALINYFRGLALRIRVRVWVSVRVRV